MAILCCDDAFLLMIALFSVEKKVGFLTVVSRTCSISLLSNLIAIAFLYTT